MTDQELVELVLIILERSYVSYSHSLVGVALECASKTVFIDCNVENTAYGFPICAKRTVLVKAVSGGRRDNFARIAAVGDSTEPCRPCGACRRMLYESAPGLAVLMTQRNHSLVKLLLLRLLTHSSGPKSLGQAPCPSRQRGAAVLFQTYRRYVCKRGGPMARNRHPEETMTKTLDMSMCLFTEQGYEYTTIQDVVDALSMPEGTIYHHLKSKEDVLDRINDRYYGDLEWSSNPAKPPGWNSLEKLHHVFRHFLIDPTKREVDRLAIHHIVRNPRIALLTSESTLRDTAPYVEGMIRLGIVDGSLPSVTHLHEIAEVLMLLTNVWTGTFPGNREEFTAKLCFRGEFLDRFGLPVLDEVLQADAPNYYDQVLQDD